MKPLRTTYYLRALGRLGLAATMVLATAWSHVACACSTGVGCKPASGAVDACQCCAAGGSCGQHDVKPAAKSCCAAKETPKPAPAPGHSCCATGHKAAAEDESTAKVSTPACTCATATADRPAFPAREQKQVLPGSLGNDAPVPLVAVVPFHFSNVVTTTAPDMAIHAPPRSAPTQVLLCTFRC